MDVRTIDHVNLLIPDDEVPRAVDFYRGCLGFEVEGLDAFERGERPIFAFRLNPTSILHVRPTSEFDPPSGTNYDHVALVVDDSIEEVKQELLDDDVTVEMEALRLGATGRAPALYVRDPFGYLVEIKEAP
ncbi:MAG: VOC family protein [Halobacteriota archaeon]